MKAMTRAKFPLGHVVATPGVLEALAESGQTPAFFLDQHASGNWGIVDEEDWLLNDEALKDGSRTGKRQREDNQDRDTERLRLRLSNPQGRERETFHEEQPVVFGR
jgi:hypothetical protein